MEWISVVDQAAPKKDILVSTLENGIQRVWWNTGFERYIVGGWESCNYCGGQSEIEYNSVTHWMPLPDPPKPDDSIQYTTAGTGQIEPIYVTNVYPHHSRCQTLESFNAKMLIGGIDYALKEEIDEGK